MTSNQHNSDLHPAQRHDSPRRGRSPILAGILIFLLLLAAGIIPRLLRAHEAQRVVHASTVLVPEVTTAHPQLAPGQSSITLPCNLLPLYSTTIFARTNGYVERRIVDIGSRVKAGQLLAVIASPEVDQQLNQARAQVLQATAAIQQAKAALAQAQANVDLAQITEHRYQHLIGTHAVTDQSLDEAVQGFNARTADVAAANANIAAAEATLKERQANVERLVQLQGFERVVAPFSGVITARNVEKGDLVNNGSGNGSQSLFSIAQSDVLRVQVEVPQSSALDIKNGQQAAITVQERPGQKYVATVTRNADSVDLSARTMLTEVQVDNHSGALVPGMYGQISFVVGSRRPAYMIPTTALVIDRNGTHVVEVDAHKNVHFVPVEIGQDRGSNYEISAGLHGGETLVTNPSDLLREGQTVAIAQ